MNWIAIPRWPKFPMSIITHRCGHVEVRYACFDLRTFMCWCCKQAGQYQARCDVPWGPYRD